METRAEKLKSSHLHCISEPCTQERVSWLNRLDHVVSLEKAQPRMWKGLQLGLQSSLPTGEMYGPAETSI